MILKNKFEKLMFNRGYNTRNKGNVVGHIYRCIYDVPGNFYKSYYIRKDKTLMYGNCTMWLLVTAIQASDGIYYQVREAVMAEDESCWCCPFKHIIQVYSKTELDLFVKQYKNT